MVFSNTTMTTSSSNVKQSVDQRDHARVGAGDRAQPFELLPVPGQR